VCDQHALSGMTASWEVASATQITRSGAATTGTLAALVTDQNECGSVRVLPDLPYHPA
jgi:hypothetical protein